MIQDLVKVVVNGTFINKNNTFFRPEAYMQWGNSEDVIGTVLMLNPVPH